MFLKSIDAAKVEEDPNVPPKIVKMFKKDNQMFNVIDGIKEIYQVPLIKQNHKIPGCDMKRLNFDTCEAKINI